MNHCPSMNIYLLLRPGLLKSFNSWTCAVSDWTLPPMVSKFKKQRLQEFSTLWALALVFLYSPTSYTTLLSFSLVSQPCPTLCNPMDCSPPGLSVRGILQTRILEWVAIPSSRGSSQPRDRIQVSHIVGGFFTDWATREAQKYWSGSPSLIQGFFPTQEWNRGHLHCRQILYCQSHQASPYHPLPFPQYFI